MGTGAEQDLARAVEELRDEPGVELPGEGRRFGSSALRVGGRIFAMAVDDRFVVKLPAARVAELVGAGSGAPFLNGAGRPMREWVAVLDGDRSALAREALAFVRGSSGAGG